MTRYPLFESLFDLYGYPMVDICCSNGATFGLITRRGRGERGKIGRDYDCQEKLG